MNRADNNDNRQEPSMPKPRKPRQDTRRDAAREPDALHLELELTPDEVDRQLAELGETPKQAIAAFDSALTRAKRTLAKDAMERIEEQVRMARAAARIRPDTIGHPLFEESVAAGPATPSSLGEARATSMSDFFRGVSSTDGNFFVRVSGVSMINAGIFDGDLAMVDPKIEPKSGDIVLAHIAPHGQVVKRLECGSDGLSLMSANPDYQPIRVDNPGDLTIHGKVVWVCGSRGR